VERAAASRRDALGGLVSHGRAGGAALRFVHKSVVLLSVLAGSERVAAENIDEQHRLDENTATMADQDRQLMADEALARERATQNRINQAASRAVLGESEAKLEKQLAVGTPAKVETFSGSGYRFRAVRTLDLVVKYYIDPASSKIFAVTWSGSRMPDLISILGFDPATLNAQAGYRSLRWTDIKTDTLLFQAGGRMGLHFGRVIRLDLIPTKVPPSVVVP
jgi:hypothetical protein